MKRILFLFSFIFFVSFQHALLAQDKKEPVAVEESVAPEMSMVNNKLHVKNAPIGKRIEIMTILGNKVKEIEIKSPDGEYEISLPKAIYIFKLDGTVRKFIVK
ncbi:T9SS type A sorting domain-containing protein [Bacteroidales bacterium OttesenSCG-928-A17]|nr:T9SS type A sorting domain-containing protein [Bacteroidales bacterium OttesenSCG-928-A17]